MASIPAEPPPATLVGSILKESGDPFGSGEAWDADSAEFTRMDLEDAKIRDYPHVRTIW